MVAHPKTDAAIAAETALGFLEQLALRRDSLVLDWPTLSDRLGELSRQPRGTGSTDA